MSQSSGSAKIQIPIGSFWWAGGASLVIIPVLALAAKFGPALGFNGVSVASWNVWLLALASLPHFVLSSFWFYRHRLLRAAHPWIAWASPVALIAAAAWMLLQDNPAVLVWAFRGGLLLLYWHFAKQAFGTALWLGRSGGVTQVSATLRSALLICCLSIGAYGFFAAQAQPGRAPIFQIYVESLRVAPWAQHLMLALALVSFGIVNSCLWRERGAVRAEASALSWRALVPVVALWVWVEPALMPLGLALAPIFHGLQSIPFTLARDSRRATGLLLLGALAVGWALLRGFPALVGATEGGGLLAGAWIFVVNVHHFLLESISWRRESLAQVEAELREGSGVTVLAAPATIAETRGENENEKSETVRWPA